MKNYPEIHRQSDPVVLKLRMEKAKERATRLWLEGLKKSDPQAHKEALDHHRAMLSRAARALRTKAGGTFASEYRRKNGELPGASAVYAAIQRAEIAKRNDQTTPTGSTKPNLER